MSAATLGRLGYAALLATLLVAVGGAASAPEGRLLGVPPPFPALLLAIGGGALMRFAPERGRVALGLLPLLLLVVLGAPVPGVGALSGRPLFALALAAGVLALAGVIPRRLCALAFLPIVSVVYLAAAARVQTQVGPEGDEPHYLMVADSLLQDGDLALQKDYAEGRYKAFYPKALEPHFRVRGRQGEVFSLHAVGLSILLLPAYAVGGYPAASFFMAALGVALALQVRGLLREALSGEACAEGVAWAVALSAPLVSYAGLLFTEVPAALGVALVLRRGRVLGDRPDWICGLVLAALPWLNVRYSVISAVLAAYLMAGRRDVRRVVRLFAPAVISAATLALYHFRLFGFFDPRRVYGRRPEFSLAILKEGLPGLLLDQEFGLLVYAPLFVLSLGGLALLWRRDRRLAATAVVLAVAVALTAGTWPMWRGGWNPPARFLVPIVPALALLVGAKLARGLSAPAAVLVGWGLWLGLAGALEPRLVHRDRDGTSPLLRAESGAEEWTRLLPGYVLEEKDRQGLAIFWSITLLAAVPWGGPGTAPGLVAATVGLMAAAGIVSSRTGTPTGGRDAVRVLGRPALAVPGYSLRREARWGPSSISWGPLYEPHRFPAGAPLGERLRLPAGRYRLEVVGDLLDERPPGVLRLQAGSAPGGPTMPWERLPTGLAATFDVPSSATDLSLILEDGCSLLLKEIRLQPLGRAPV